MLDTNNQLWPSVKAFVMIKHRGKANSTNNHGGVNGSAVSANH